MDNNFKFGKECRNFFQMEKNYLNLNSGSFGTSSKYVTKKVREYQDILENNPDKFLRFHLNNKLNEVREVVANYVNTESSNIVLVQNATDGLNTILKSILKNKGEKLLMFDISYVAVKSIAKYLVDTIGIEIVEVKLDEETLNSEEKILEKIKNALENNANIKLANIDHISSIPGLILPVEKIINLMRPYGIPILIDGAHTAGHIPLNLKEINPDFYISNFHKWCFSSKSSCFLYVSQKYHDIIHPNTLSKSYGGGFVKDFSNAGCKDYSSYLAIRDAIEFRKQIGEERIMEYNSRLAVQVGEIVSKIWGTEVLIKDFRSCAMVNVRVPCDDQIIIEECVKKAMFEYNFSILVFKFSNGKFYVRFSCQIFNEIQDYKYAAEIFLKLLNDLTEEKLVKAKF